MWLWLLILIPAIAVLATYRYFKNGPFKGKKTRDGAYDAVIVGAGPSGSTLAHYLALQGKKVALLERKTFPRVKFCGDAWCSPALDILEEMGILQELEQKGLCYPIKRGGFISPSGNECIGGPYGSVSKIRTYSIKRVIVDEFIAKKAQKTGAELIEEFEVVDCTFRKEDDGGLWCVKNNKGEEKLGRILILADGSKSNLARKLGIIPNVPSSAFCSHQYIKGGTHTLGKDDGVIFYTKSLLPSYSAIMRHYNDDMYLGTYILPGGDATTRIIPAYEKGLREQHPYVKAAFGENFDWEVTPKTAEIRIGGVPKSYSNQLLVIGDAAGLVDPLTGEGIHTAMISGKIAAKTIGEMFQEGDFSEESCKVYHARWYHEMGFDMAASSFMGKIMYRFPIVIDALARMGKGRGQQFLDDFGAVMTGVDSKAEFLKPKHSIPILGAIIAEIWNQKVLGKQSTVPDIGKPLLDGMKKGKKDK